MYSYVFLVRIRTLYAVFISDFKKPPNCEIALYADDTAIFTSSKQIRGVLSKLQKGLNAANRYFRKWKIKPNPEKSQAICFPSNNSKRLIPSHNLDMNNNEIPFGDNAKYLGIILDKKLNFGSHIKYMCEKAVKCNRSLYPFLNRRSKLSLDNKMLLYTQVIRAILTYGCQVFKDAANCHMKKIQIIQNKNLKIINNLPWRFPTSVLHENTEVPMISVFIEQQCSSFYAKCEQSSFPLIRNLVE